VQLDALFRQFLLDRARHVSTSMSEKSSAPARLVNAGRALFRPSCSHMQASR
jgi:hypothetical protein